MQLIDRLIDITKVHTYIHSSK